MESHSKMMSLDVEYSFGKKLAPFGMKAQENFQKMVESNKGTLDFSAIIEFNK